MDGATYQKLANETESNLSEKDILGRLGETNMLRLLHSAIGICTEAGELQDVLKKHLYYGKALTPGDMDHIVEELGDLLWYIALGCSSVNMSMDEVMRRNIEKLKRVRYAKGFSKEAALNRDLDAEKEALKGGG